MTATAGIFFPINDLSPYNRSWTIKARVTTKSQPRTFNRKVGGGEGKLFSVDLLDAEGGQIRATFFNEAVAKYEKMIEQGKVFLFSGGQVRIANKQYTSLSHRYELSFDNSCNVEPASDDVAIGTIRFEIVDLRALQSRPLPCSVDLCGVVQSSAEVAKLVSKAGQDLVKRDIVLADDTGFTLQVTLWGETAQRKDSDFEGNPVLVIKGVKISDFGERSGSTISSSTLKFNPEDVPDAKRLQSWWKEGGSAQQLTNLTTRGGGGGARADTKMMSLKEVRAAVEACGASKPEYYSTVVRMQAVQTRKQGEKKEIYYLACAETKPNGLKCNRKVGDDGRCPVCEKATETAVRLMPRCQFVDSTDSLWMTTFDQGAQAVLGLTGDEVRTADRSGDKLESILQAAYSRLPFKLNLRARREDYMGESRSKVDCVDARPVSWGEHGRSMLKEVMDAIAVH
jgi:replication factor A1